MSGSGSSVPSGRSPFPASRNPRTRGATGNGGLGLTVGGTTIPSSLGGDSMSSRTSSTTVGGGHYNSNPLGMTSGLLSTTSSTGFGGMGGDSVMETSVQPSHEGHLYNQQSPVFHGMLRFSPNNSYQNAGGVSSWSPLYRGNSVTNAGRGTGKPRFFESSTTNTRSLNNSSLRSSEADNHRSFMVDSSKEQSTNDNISGKRTDETPKDELVIDGIPIDQLRSLAQQALFQSPQTSVFYTSILYSKTGKPHDALLLAKANYATGQYTTCLRVLDEGNLLQQEYPWDAVIVACLALQAQRNWVALAEMVEDVCRAPDPATAPNTTVSGNNIFGSSYNKSNQNFRSLSFMSPPLEDDDTLGWIQLKHSIDNLTKGQDRSTDFLIMSYANQLHPLAQICFFRAQAYYEMSCMMRAVVYWKRSLQMDCQCQMAWEALLKRNLLTPGEAYDWITQELTFQPQQEWLRSLYLARIELTQQENTKSSGSYEHAAAAAAPSSTSTAAPLLDASSIPLSSPMPSFYTPGGFSKGVMLDEIHIDNEDPVKDVHERPIHEDIDTAFNNLLNKHKLQDAPQVLAMAARRSYRRYEWNAALGYCEDLVQLDPAASEAEFCYIATLVVLGYKRTLFRLAHEWVEADPKSAQAWFAVGAYYYCIQRYHVAQRHFCRATRLNPQCTEAWIAFGCSFAACDESDQALASYRAAQRLSPGEHTSLLYMGMEYVRTNHLVLASYFLNAALTASGGDPLCLHELGVLSSHKGDHKAAISWYRSALSAVGIGGKAESSTDTSSLMETVDLLDDNYWEATLFNLGHSYRKTRQFDKAAICFYKCTSLCPDKYSTYAALAFTKQLMGDLDSAISLFHQSLSLKADDPFSTEMLNRALQEHTMSRKQRIFDTTTTMIPVPPLAEATNLSTKNSTTTIGTTKDSEHQRNGVNHLSLSSMVLSSPTITSTSSSYADKNASTLSEEMDCDLSATS